MWDVQTKIFNMPPVGKMRSPTAKYIILYTNRIKVQHNELNNIIIIIIVIIINQRPYNNNIMTHVSCNCGYASRGLDQWVSPFSPLYHPRSSRHLGNDRGRNHFDLHPPGACDLCCNATTVQVHPHHFWIWDFVRGGGKKGYNAPDTTIMLLFYVLL